MKYANTVLELVGNTPLVKLNSVTEGIAATVLVKVEYLNPGGSSKDRIATRIIDAAEASGELKPGGTIVEPTSGNTGIGLALVAQQRGYRCVFVLPDKVGEEKRNTLTAYGAEIVVTPTAVAPDSPESYYSVSDRLAREIPGAFKPNQYANQNGPLSHYETTGPEIWRDTDGRITHFVAGVGTGGTISGAGRYLKEVSDGAVQVIGADPEGSVYSGGTGRPYLVEGVGEDFWPTAYDPSVVDQIVAASDAESFELTLRLAREEGLLVGGSSGMAVASALKVARGLPADAIMVILLPDGGRGYLNKVFSDKWMSSHGFTTTAAGASVADVFDTRVNDDFVHLRPETTVRDAVALMTARGLATLPVTSAEPPVVMGEVIGSVSESSLAEALTTGSAQLNDPVAEVVGEPIPLVGAGQSLDDLVGLFAHTETVMVARDGKPLGILTRRDLLTYHNTPRNGFPA
jgi:cystathionine beta-synthase